MVVFATLGIFCTRSITIQWVDLTCTVTNQPPGGRLDNLLRLPACSSWSPFHLGGSKCATCLWTRFTLVFVLGWCFELFTSSGLHGWEAWQERTASWMDEKIQDLVTFSLKKPPVCRLSTTTAARKEEETQQWAGRETCSQCGRTADDQCATRRQKLKVEDDTRYFEDPALVRKAFLLVACYVTVPIRDKDL